MNTFRALDLESRATILTQAAEELANWPARRQFRNPALASEIAVVVFTRDGAAIHHRGDFAHTLKRRGRYRLALECVRRSVGENEQLLFFASDDDGGCFEVVNHEREKQTMATELAQMKATLAELEAHDGGR